MVIEKFPMKNYSWRKSSIKICDWIFRWKMKRYLCSSICISMEKINKIKTMFHIFVNLKINKRLPFRNVMKLWWKYLFGLTYFVDILLILISTYLFYIYDSNHWGLLGLNFSMPIENISYQNYNRKPTKFLVVFLIKINKNID